jgi:hypothetical protein
MYPLREVHNDQRVFEITQGMLSWLTTSQRRDVVWQDRRDLLRVSQIIAVFASFLSQVQLEHRPVDGDACNPAVDDACIPTDMTFSAMRSIKISSTDFSSALCSPDIHTCNQGDRVGEQTDKVIKWTARSRQHNMRYAINSLLARISQFEKSGPNAASDGLNKQRRNRFLQWVRNASINMNQVRYGAVPMVQRRSFQQ